MIFIVISKNCEIAPLYAFLTATKQPFKTEDIAIKGKPNAIKYSGIEEIILFNQFLIIKSENKNRIILLDKPNNIANVIHVFTAVRPFKKSFLANCSETIEIQAMFNPDVAIVIANI